MAHETRVRELSPWSARRALTEKMNQDQPGHLPSPPARQNNSPWTRDVPERQNHKTSPPRESREPERNSPAVRRTRELEPERDRLRDSPRDRRSKESSAKAASVAQRDSSPEPYRKSRDSETKRDRSKDRYRNSRRDRSRDRRDRRDTSRDRRDTSTDRRDRRDTSRDRRDRAKERDYRRDRSKDSRRRDRRDRSKDGRRDRSRDRRDRSRDRRRDRSRDSGRRDRDRRRYRSRSPRSPPPKRRKHTRSSPASRSPSPHRRSKAALPPQDVSFRGTDNAALPPSKYGGAPAAMEKPNFKTTGALAKAANRVEGTKISLKYHEPAEARKPSPKDQWKIVVFKGDDVVDTIELHKKSCWLFGRSVEVVDHVLEHPSSSGQHAVIQFRYIQKTVEDEFGVKKQTGKVKPYVIDLESSNGTELNGERIETSRYMELRHKDTLVFAGSEREYVVILPPPEKKSEA